MKNPPTPATKRNCGQTADRLDVLQTFAPSPERAEIGLVKFGQKLLDIGLQPEALALQRLLFAAAPALSRTGGAFRRAQPASRRDGNRTGAGPLWRARRDRIIRRKGMPAAPRLGKFAVAGMENAARPA